MWLSCYLGAFTEKNNIGTDFETDCIIAHERQPQFHLSFQKIGGIHLVELHLSRWHHQPLTSRLSKHIYLWYIYICRYTHTQIRHNKTDRKYEPSFRRSHFIAGGDSAFLVCLSCLQTVNLLLSNPRTLWHSYHLPHYKYCRSFWSLRKMRNKPSN